MNQGTKNFIPQKGEKNEQQDVITDHPHSIWGIVGKYPKNEP